ncbi:MAG: SRPBCC family protein [Promethearchaeota archaeon]
MTKVMAKIEINAPPNKIYNTLTDLSFNSKWNPAVLEITETGPNKRAVKTQSEDYTFTVIEQKENESFTCEAVSEYFNSFGYSLKTKGDITEVSSWIDYKIVEHEKILQRGIKYILGGLKSFVEFLEDGGDPDEFDRKQILVKP